MRIYIIFHEIKFIHYKCLYSYFNAVCGISKFSIKCYPDKCVWDVHKFQSDSCLQRLDVLRPVEQFKYPSGKIKSDNVKQAWKRDPYKTQ